MNMHSDNGTSKQTQEQLGADQTVVARNRDAWERPALRRLDAADAEFMGGVGADVQGES